MSKPKPYQTEVPAAFARVSGASRSTAGPSIPATVVPDNWTPNRKWFAAAVGAILVNLLAAVGVDVGALGVAVAELVGISADEQAVEAAVRTAVGALAGQYLWPEWRSLPETVRGALRKLTAGLR